MQIPSPIDPVESLKAAFPDAVKHVKTFRGELTIYVNAEKIVGVMLHLRNTGGLLYNFLSDISGVDYYPNDYGNDWDGEKSDYRPERFGVSYHLYSMLYNRRLRIKTFALEEEPAIPSIVQVWPAANWLEREIYDMLGIEFQGHPDMRRLLMPQDWDGHPHRRDYPLGYETIQFSFNAEEIIKHKPLAKD